MVSFFKKNKKNEGIDVNKDIKEEIQQENKNESSDENLDIKLSLHPDETGRVSKFQAEYLQEEIDELPPIKENQVNVTGVFLFDQGDQYEVKVYFQNGYTSPINFHRVPLQILDSEGNVLAKQLFDLSDLGDIPPKSARPWKIYFDKENVVPDKIGDDWVIVFDTNLRLIRNVNTVYEGIPENLHEGAKEQLEQFLTNLGPLREKTLDLTRFYVGVKENGNILIVFVARNGGNREVVIERIPITIKDDQDRIVAGGIFETNLSINPYKAKVCNLEFDSQYVSKGNVNLDKLEVYFSFNENAFVEPAATEEEAKAEASEEIKSEE